MDYLADSNTNNVLVGCIAVGVGFVALGWGYATHQVSKAVQFGLKARLAAQCLEQGDNFQDHKYALSDLNFNDVLSIGKLVAGKENVSLLERKTKEYDDSFNAS